MSTHLSITRDEADGRGRYSSPTVSSGTAELTYRWAGKKRIIIDHTYVPPSARGRGIAEALVRRAVEDARVAGVLVRPHCSYAALIMHRHADLQDVLDA